MKKLLIGSTVCILMITALYSVRFVPMLCKPSKAECLKHTTLLIKNAGGTEKVCAEADLMFSRFGVANMTPFFDPKDSRLTNYPAISSLGWVKGIWPGNPPYILIQIGHHLHGYTIIVVDTKGPGKPDLVSNMIEFAHSRIYVGN